jgi:hypothetical protein
VDPTVSQVTHRCFNAVPFSLGFLAPVFGLDLLAEGTISYYGSLAQQRCRKGFRLPRRGVTVSPEDHGTQIIAHLWVSRSAFDIFPRIFSL